QDSGAVRLLVVIDAQGVNSLGVGAGLGLGREQLALPAHLVDHPARQAALEGPLIDSVVQRRLHGALEQAQEHQDLLGLGQKVERRQANGPSLCAESPGRMVWSRPPSKRGPERVGRGWGEQMQYDFLRDERELVSFAGKVLPEVTADECFLLLLCARRKYLSEEEKALLVLGEAASVRREIVSERGKLLQKVKELCVGKGLYK